jgi:hypothetical protein
LDAYAHCSQPASEQLIEPRLGRVEAFARRRIAFIADGGYQGHIADDGSDR